ncbi:MAG: adenylosuccinate synthase [Acidobacteriota bacterium]|jgi:adenylosuccinate synthase
MINLVVVGGQWGDEGKGKIVDLLCPAFSHVARFNGGNNAGHTVRFADRHLALHLIPSGITHPHCRCLVGPGVVIDPLALVEEIRTLEGQSIDVRKRLLLSPRAHLTFPGHRLLDGAREASKGRGRIGTTGRGIGPTYETRAARTGVRLGLVRNPRRFREAAAQLCAELDRLLGCAGSEVRPGTEDIEAYMAAALELAPMVGDTALALAQAVSRGEPILFEGAQGTFLDIDHGTYPYVTSSNCLAGFAAPASGLPARVLGGVLAVFKAYTTRVGEGPFPTEMTDSIGDHLRRRGNEFGTTTGRPRRIGWFDAVAAAAAVRLNGIDAVALTKLDVLDEVPTIRIATAYRSGEKLLHHLPDDDAELARLDPVYEDLPGWQTVTAGMTSFSRLPELARRYIARLEELLGVPICLVSTGPRREETLVLEREPFTSWFPQLGARRS